jgi:hypothetical protein
MLFERKVISGYTKIDREEVDGRVYYRSVAKGTYFHGLGAYNLKSASLA